MREWLVITTEFAVVIIDWIALLVILYGTVEAIGNAARLFFAAASPHRRRDAWLRYGRWLVLGLTFQLASDIIETSITTEWEALVRLAVIAVIRTFLNFFLERDLQELREREEQGRAGTAG